MICIQDCNCKSFLSFDDFEKYYEKKALKLRDWLQLHMTNFYSGQKNMKLFSVHFVLLQSDVKDCKRGLISWTLDDFDNVVSCVKHKYIYSC